MSVTPIQLLRLLYNFSRGYPQDCIVAGQKWISDLPPDFLQKNLNWVHWNNTYNGLHLKFDSASDAKMAKQMISGARYLQIPNAPLLDIVFSDPTHDSGTVDYNRLQTELKLMSNYSRLTFNEINRIKKKLARKRHRNKQKQGRSDTVASHIDILINNVLLQAQTDQLNILENLVKSSCAKQSGP